MSMATACRVQRSRMTCKEKQQTKMKINKENLSWLTTVPASDINFRTRLKESNLVTMQEALKNKKLSKSARRFIEAEIGRKK